MRVRGVVSWSPGKGTVCDRWHGDGTMPGMRKLLREFRAFALSGNVLDLALGFLIGAAFSGLIQSLARNVLLQLVAATFGQTDFNRLHFSINKARIYYGSFLTDLLNFVLLAAVLFMIVKVMSGIGLFSKRG